MILHTIINLMNIIPLIHRKSRWNLYMHRIIQFIWITRNFQFWKMIRKSSKISIIFINCIITNSNKLIIWTLLLFILAIFLIGKLLFTIISLHEISYKKEVNKVKATILETETSLMFSSG